jgi:hypothetical protein
MAFISNTEYPILWAARGRGLSAFYHLSDKGVIEYFRYFHLVELELSTKAGFPLENMMYRSPHTLKQWGFDK